MQQPTLYSKFSHALSWNAFLYFAHRLCSTAFVFVFYRGTTTEVFSLWSTLLSSIFLILLWLDFGFRKSIARYAPVFTQHRAFRYFTDTVLIFQLTALSLAAPLFYLGVPYLCRFILHSSTPLASSVLLLAALLFISEGLIEILRLLYHAHFLNKPFNLIATAARLTESTTSILIITFLHPASPLATILTVKLLCSLTIIIATVLYLPRLYRTAQHDIPATTTSSLRPVWHKFIRHSGMMWASNTIKSLSERNFILPFLTYTLGAASANIFKLAQDSALFFERSIIKTIGTADTALLAHAATEAKGNGVEDNAFKKLTRQVAGLCIPLFGILFFLFLAGTSYIKDLNVFRIFLLLTATYLLEVLVSPYERVLEVKQRYLLLGFAYAPYMVGLCLLLYQRAYFGLLGFVLFLQGVRLVSSSLMVLFVYRAYRLPFPLRFTLGWLGVVMAGVVMAWAVVHRLFPYHKVPFLSLFF